MLSISGVFSVTFSVVFAYVADVTTEEDRSQAYGLVLVYFLLSSWLSYLKSMVHLSDIHLNLFITRSVGARQLTVLVK